MAPYKRASQKGVGGQGWTNSNARTRQMRRGGSGLGRGTFVLGTYRVWGGGGNDATNQANGCWQGRGGPIAEGRGDLHAPRHLVFFYFKPNRQGASLAPDQSSKGGREGWTRLFKPTRQKRKGGKLALAPEGGGDVTKLGCWQGGGVCMPPGILFLERGDMMWEDFGKGGGGLAGEGG
jgi:hypothetical protein